MQDLVKLEDYDLFQAQLWKRLRLLAGWGFGVIMGLMLFAGSLTAGVWYALALATIIGAVAGLAFGFIWTGTMRSWARRFMIKVYEGDRSVIGAPSPNAHARLPCGWFRSRNVVIGGILYLGPDGATFVPHQRFQRGVPPVALGRVDAVAAVDWKPNWLTKLFVVSKPRALELKASGSSYLFNAPEPDRIAQTVTQALRG
jgi:hypothetical protein